MEGKTLFSWLNSTTFKLVFFGGVSAVSIYFVVKSFSKAPIRPILKEVDFTKALPEEVILQVFRHCNAEDLAQASQVCKEWNRFTGDDQVWKEIYLKQWRKVESNLSLELQPRHKSSWKEMYIERFVIEKVCFPRKKAIFSADSVQGLMYKASKLIEKAQNFSSSSLATSTELHYAVTPFSLLAVAAESYEACFVLETERKEKAKTSQASSEEKDSEEKEEADRKLEAEILWRWGLVLIKQAAYVPEEDIAEKERLLDLGHDKCEQSLYLHDNLKKRLKLANRFFNRATSLRGSEEARFIFLFKKARAHYRLALQTIEDEEVNHEGEKQGEPANDEVFDELLGVKKRNFSIEKAKAYRQLGWAYYSEVESLSERGQSVLEMLKASRDCYKYALEYEPESVESFSQMAKVLSLMGKIIEDREEADANMQEALTYYRRSIMYNGKDPDLLNQYGILLIASAQKREGDEVERLYAEAEDIFVRLEKISWFGGINLACLSAIRGREEETKKWLVKCFKNDHLELEHLEDRDFDGFREKDWFLELVTALEGREDNN